jgi:hypothetical protein
MKVYELAAALVARTQLQRQLSWSELGDLFGLTKDAVRNRVNRFKEKYNIVDADIDTGWAREFLKEHTPETEKAELNGARYIPGTVVIDSNAFTAQVIVRPKGDYIYITSQDVPTLIYVGDEVEETPYDDQLTFAETADPVKQVDPLKFLITPAVLVVIRDEQPLTIDKTHKNFAKIQSSLEAGEWQAVLDYIDMKNAITKYSNGRVMVQDGIVTLDGERVGGQIVQRLINGLLEENLEQLEALSNFLDKCDENPDYRVVTRIYDFIAHNDLRLDKDGYVLAYKVVKNSYLDKYTGTMNNSPGQVVQMKRNKVNPKDEETCSHGLHVAAKRYIPSYGSPSLYAGGDRVVLCRVNPKDFVSIPTDYSSMKARVCEYTVLKDVTELFVNHNLDDEGIPA